MGSRAARARVGCPRAASDHDGALQTSPVAIVGKCRYAACQCDYCSQLLSLALWHTSQHSRLPAMPWPHRTHTPHGVLQQGPHSRVARLLSILCLQLQDLKKGLRGREGLLVIGVYRVPRDCSRAGARLLVVLCLQQQRLQLQELSKKGLVVRKGIRKSGFAGSPGPAGGPARACSAYFASSSGVSSSRRAPPRWSRNFERRVWG